VCQRRPARQSGTPGGRTGGLGGFRRPSTEHYLTWPASANCLIGVRIDFVTDQDRESPECIATNYADFVTSANAERTRVPGGASGKEDSGAKNYSMKRPFSFVRLPL
jgi:hypothetical protein